MSRPDAPRKFGVVLSMRKKGVWPALAEPVRVAETQVKMRAASILAGMTFRDESKYPPPLTLDQAVDVVAWARMPIM